MGMDRLGTSLLLAALAAALAPLQALTPSPPPAPALDPIRPLWQPGESRYVRSFQVRTVDAPVADEAGLTAGAGWSASVSWTDPADLAGVAGGGGAPAAPRHLYAYATVTRETGGPAELSIGAGAGVTAWMNGVAVGRVPGGVFRRDKARLPVTLQPGENRILLRLDNPGADWRLAVRLLAPGQPLPEDRQLAQSLWTEGDVLVVRTDAAASDRAATVSVMAPGGRVVTQARTSRSGEVRLPIGPLPEGPYGLRVASADAWGRPIHAYAYWMKGGLPSAAQALLDRAAAATGADAEAGHWRLLGRIVADRLGADPSRASPGSVESILFEAAELAQGTDAGVHGSGFVRLAWIDPVDASPQFCRAYLPHDYDSRRAWPTVLLLHGFNPLNPPLERMWGADARHTELPDRHGVIWIEPHGRGNTSYLGVGEADVLRCVDEATRRLRVDRDRLYLAGESMGGMGTWTLATRHPQRWAAIAPIFGGFDMRTALGVPDAAQPHRPMEHWWVESGSSFNGAESLIATPVFVHQGDLDEDAHPRFSRAIVGQMQRWGYGVQYREYPGFIHEDLSSRDEQVAWLLRHSRVEAPRHVRVRSADLDGASAWWLRVEGAQEPMRMIEADAEATEPGVIRLDTRNVAAITLSPPRNFLRSDRRLQLVWNGETHDVAVGSQGSATIRLPDAPAGPLLKRPGLAGGLSDVVATPFAIVVGTISPDPEMRRLIRERAEQRAAAWAGAQHVRPRMVDDIEVTSEMERTLSLVLIGGADANGVTRRIADRLPMEVEPAGVTVDGRRFAATDSVLEMVRPSPFAPDRYVLVVAATSPGGMYLWNPAAFWLGGTGLPTRLWDWTLRDGRVALTPTLLPDRTWIASGVFDQQWRRDDRWTFLGDPAVRQAATLRRMPPEGFVVSAAILERYVGRYEAYSGMTIDVRREGDHLMLEPPGGPAIPLVPERETLFASPGQPGSIEFRLGPDGSVIDVLLDNGTNLSVWRRTANGS